MNIKPIKAFNKVNHIKSDKRIRQKKTEYVRLLQRRGRIKRYWLTKDGMVTNGPKMNGHNNIMAYDADEFRTYRRCLKRGRPRKEN